MAIIKKHKKEKANRSLSGFLDAIAPMGIRFQTKYLEFGDHCERILVIKNFPTGVHPAWLSRVVDMPGVTASIHLYPTDPYDLIESINISMGELESKIEDGGSPVQKSRNQEKYNAAKKLIQKIDQEQQTVFFLTVVIKISAKDKDLLDMRTREVEATLAGSGLRARTPIFKQENGLMSVGPWAVLDPDIDQIGARNMPAESVAASYPFVYSGLNDGKGILLGTDKNGGIVLVDFWLRSKSRTNSNLTMMGRPGVGKSTTVKKILLHEYAQGTKIIIIDPEREYKDLCDELNGDWIDCGGGSKGRINPLQIRSVPMDDEDDDEPLYKNDHEKGLSPLSLHIQTLRTFFRLYLRDISKKQNALLEKALIEVYQKHRIDWDTDPNTIPNEQWPTLKDLHQTISEKIEDGELGKDWRELALLLESVAFGADSGLWSGHTTIQTKSNVVVLDIHNLLESDEEIQRAQFFNVLGWAWNEISKNREEKVLLATDETYLLVDPEIPQALKYLRNTSKRIRKYEGGLMVITHNLVDFLDPAVRRYGQALIDNPVYKLIMGQGDKDIEALSKLMTLSEREMQTLADGERGEALFVAGNRRLHLKIDVTEHELEIFGKGGGR